MPPRRCRVSSDKRYSCVLRFSKTMQNHLVFNSFWRCPPFLFGSHVGNIEFHSALHIKENYLRSSVPIKLKLPIIQRLTLNFSLTFRRCILGIVFRHFWTSKMGAGMASGGPLGALRGASGSLRMRRKAPMACRRPPGGPWGLPGSLWRPPGGRRTFLEVSKIAFWRSEHYWHVKSRAREIEGDRERMNLHRTTELSKRVGGFAKQLQL